MTSGRHTESTIYINPQRTCRAESATHNSKHLGQPVRVVEDSTRRAEGAIYSFRRGRPIPTSGRRNILPVALILLTLAFCASRLEAQGCAQCLDSTRATPPQVQAAYRHAIYLLGGTGAAIFIAATLMLRRNNHPDA